MQPYICGICRDELSGPPLRGNDQEQSAANGTLIVTNCGHVFHDFCFSPLVTGRMVIDCPQCGGEVPVPCWIESKTILFLSQSDVEKKLPFEKKQLKNMSKEELCGIVEELSKQLCDEQRDAVDAGEKEELTILTNQILERELREMEIQVIRMTAKLILQRRLGTNVQDAGRVRPGVAKMSTGGLARGGRAPGGRAPRRRARRRRAPGRRAPGRRARRVRAPGGRLLEFAFQQPGRNRETDGIRTLQVRNQATQMQGIDDNMQSSRISAPSVRRSERLALQTSALGSNN